MKKDISVRFEGLGYPTFEKHYSDYIGIGANGHLWVDGCDCVKLAERYGTPLYVISEGQFRHNFRRFRDAFKSRYPSVEILFANKSNNAPAVRHIMNEEGAGGDCFGYEELYLALASGADPAALVLNGSNKTEAELRLAIEAGVAINLDAMDELDLVLAQCRALGRRIDIGIRAKLELPALAERYASDLHGAGSLAEQCRAHKWGMPFAQTVELVRRIEQNEQYLNYTEISYHLGRLSNAVGDFAEMARDMVRWSKRILDETGVATPGLDLGGGFAFGRPERTGPNGDDDENTPSYEEYAEGVCAAVREECERQGLPLPHLKIEPGRSIAAPTTILIGRVGAVKEWPGYKKWVNVDCSTNHVLRIFTSHWYHHIVAVNKASQAATETVDLVGPLCNPDELGNACQLPSLVRGDLVALLDTGSYAESTVATFNAQPRPATVLVNGERADIVTERDSLGDIAGRYRIPSWLLAAKT